MCRVKALRGYLLQLLKMNVSEDLGAVLACGEPKGGGSVNPRHIWTNSETRPPSPPYQTKERLRKAAK